MRVELLYAPGCSSFSRARNTLEMVIAEERLPVPIEMIEEHGQIHGFPTIRIDGAVISPKHHFDSIRDALQQRWQELTSHPLQA
jgi:hypothetical protein